MTRIRRTTRARTLSPRSRRTCRSRSSIPTTWLTSTSRTRARLEITNPSKNVPGPTAYQVSASDVLPPNWTYKPGSTVITLDGSETRRPIRWRLDRSAGRETQLVRHRRRTAGELKDRDHVPGDAGPERRDGPGRRHRCDAASSAHQHREHLLDPGTPTSNWDLQTSKNVTAQTEIASADLELIKTHDNQNPAVGKDKVVPGRSSCGSSRPPTRARTRAWASSPSRTHCLQAPSSAATRTTPVASCNAVGQKVTCTNPGPVNGLAKDASLSDLVLNVYVDPAFTGDMKNTATVNGRT